MEMYLANANIADKLTENELQQMQYDCEVNFVKLLEILRNDPNDPNCVETPKRLAKMYLQEVMKGRYKKKPKLTSFPNTKNVNELFIVGPIKVRSLCSHHFVPFIGKVWVGVIPNKKLLGISKFARLADWIMSRPQIQEEAVEMLADLLEEELQPKGLAIVMRAKHFCMCWRGIKDDDCEMTSSIVRGLLRGGDARNEFLNLMNQS